MRRQNGAARGQTASVTIGQMTAILAIVCGVAASIGGIAQVLHIWQPDLRGPGLLVAVFWVDGDRDVWTWVSAVIWLICALLLITCWLDERQRDRRFARYWLTLALLFVVMSVDDVARLHERSERMLEWLPTTGLFYYKWTLLAIPFVTVVGLLYLRFLWRLPRWVAWRIVLSGGIFVGGAVGLEMISSHIVYHEGMSPLYHANTFIEECVEQAGLIVFIHTLLSYLASRGVTWQVHYGDHAVHFLSRSAAASAASRETAVAQPVPDRLTPATAVADSQ